MVSMDQKISKLTKDVDDLKQGQEALREDVTVLKQGQEEIREDLDEVRTSTNALLEWSERMSSLEQFKFPKIG